MIDALPLLLAPEGYQISRSVRLRSSASAYFNRTPASAGNRRTWTWSGWVKRGLVNGNRRFILGTNSTGGVAAFYFEFDTSERLNIGDYASPSWNWQLTTTQVFRDPSSWYHIVLVFDSSQATSSNRIKLYINGIQVTAFGTANYPTLNYDGYWNNTTLHTIGDLNGASLFLDGYLTEVNFIDGQALTPSSFGETDAVTGVWKPKKYAGTYGTNGFYLNFSDNSAATAAAIGKDYSGNGNNWTPTGVSVATGSAYDSMLDVPTMWADGGNGRGNYCVWSPLDQNGLTFANANLNISTASGRGRGNMFVSSGKWYWEVLVQTMPSTSTFGVADASAKMNTPNDAQTRGYLSTGSKISNGTSSAYGATFTVGDTVGVALDVDAGTLVFYKNGVSQGTAYSDLAGNTWAPFAQGGFACDANFGQRPFAYTPPTGFKALNTQNLPEPLISNGRKWFDASLWSGTGATQSITNGGFQPDLVWVKSRSAAASHNIVDAVRGLGNTLYSDATAAEGFLANQVTALNSSGFTLGADTNGGTNLSGRTYVGWQWKESATAGFDIVTYTGNGTAGRTVSHSLGVAPNLMIVKPRSASGDDNWKVYHSSIGATGALFLNTTSATSTSNVYWNNTAPTSSFFTVSSSTSANYTNQNTIPYVAYLFAQVAGFSRFGSYTGNGSADGPFVFCGFRPRWVMWKRTDSTADWTVFDTSRGTYNVQGPYLIPNTSGADTTDSTVQMDFLSNGFKVRGTWQGMNASGGTIIFAAFAENPFKYSLAR